MGRGRCDPPWHKRQLVGPGRQAHEWGGRMCVCAWGRCGRVHGWGGGHSHQPPPRLSQPLPARPPTHPPAHPPTSSLGAPELAGQPAPPRGAPSPSARCVGGGGGVFGWVGGGGRERAAAIHALHRMCVCVWGGGGGGGSALTQAHNSRSALQFSQGAQPSHPPHVQHKTNTRLLSRNSHRQLSPHTRPPTRTHTKQTLAC